MELSLYGQGRQCPFQFRAWDTLGGQAMAVCSRYLGCLGNTFTTAKVSRTKENFDIANLCPIAFVLVCFLRVVNNLRCGCSSFCVVM